ncbi:hydroxyisourate hydrolase [Rhodococcus opacus]|nr:hydroxyisourate hydrolase [Rhodococcus opacus]RZK95722.1 MAG: hydroxyisourate hydrolase [Rhodococcus sp. (in: high G+C Gram-positive bacteria)]
MSKILSTHVLDATDGTPAAGVHVRLLSPEGDVLASAATDSDGRIAEIAPEGLIAATYSLVFETGEYFAARGQATFYPQVSVTFVLDDPQRGYHVPLLLSPFAYSTYRGS